MDYFRNTHCSFCHTEITKDSPVAECSICSTVVHIECAEYNDRKCPAFRCSGELIFHPEKITISVSGSNAKDVELVARSLLKQTQTKSNKKWDVWITGGFYAVTLIAIGTLLLVISSLVPLFVLPIIVIGTLLLLSIIGAFQLRQDESLSEKNFLNLMMMVFTKIRFFDGRKK
jgi:hypothetical protein